MSNITVREKVEWCNYYWDNVNVASLPRILLIGDSIALSYRAVVAEMLKNEFCVDLLATSKGISDSAFKQEIDYILQEYKYEIIHFNNGLHALHIDDKIYLKNLIFIFNEIKQMFPQTTFIWASSTPVSKVNCSEVLDNDINERVVSRNRIAEDFMTANNIRVNDLYQIVLGKPEIRLNDAFHYNDEGCKLMGNAVVKTIREELEGK